MSENVKVIKVRTSEHSSPFYRIITVIFSDGSNDVYKIYVPNHFAIGSEYHLNVGVVPVWTSFNRYMAFSNLIKSGCLKDEFFTKLKDKVRDYIFLYYKICERTDDPWLNYQISHGFGYKKEQFTGRIDKEFEHD